MPITSLTSYFNTSSFGDQNASTRNQEELALTLDSAAHELSNWKTLLSMSVGGAGYEGGRLVARTLLGSVPALGVLPFLADAFTFAFGVLSDTTLSSWISQALENESGESHESFFERFTSQSSVRGMALLGMGQSFVVTQVLLGLATLGREAVCQEGVQKGKAGFLHSFIQGVQCYLGSGMFSYMTGGAVNAVEQRIRLRTKHMNTSLGDVRRKVSENLEQLGGFWGVTEPSYKISRPSETQSPLISKNPNLLANGKVANDTARFTHAELLIHVRRLKDAKMEVENELGRLESEHGALKEAIARQEVGIQELEKELGRACDAILVLNRNITALEVQNRDLRAAHVALTAELEEVQAIARVRSEADQERLQKEIAQEHLQLAQVELLGLYARYQQLEDKLAETRTALERAQRGDFSAELERAAALNEELKAQLEREREVSQDLDSQLLTLRRELEAERTRARELEAALEAHRRADENRRTEEVPAVKIVEEKPLEDLGTGTS